MKQTEKLKRLVSQSANEVDKTHSSDLKQETSSVAIFWKKTQAFSAIFLKVFFAFLFVMLIIHTMIELFRYDLVIKPFDMPFHLAREGYTGTVVARRLQDEMDNIRETINRSSARGAVQGIASAQFTELQKQQQIEIPTVGLSLNTIVQQMRKMFGIKQRSIKGDVVLKGEQFYMSLRITGKPVILIPSDADIDVVIKRAAKQVIKRLEPLTFGLSYYINNKRKNLEALIKQIRQVNRFQKTTLSDKEEAIALTLEGCLLKLQAKKSDQALLNEALDKFNQAQALAPNIRVIFRMKGDTLQDLREFDKAIAEYQAAIEIDTRQPGGIDVQWALALIEKRKQLAKSDQFKNEAEKKAILAQYQNAIMAKYQEASENDQDNPLVYASWGERLALEFKDYAGAYQKLAIAQTKNANYALTYAIRGNVLQKEGDQLKKDKQAAWREKYQAAIEQYEKAVKRDSSIAWMYGNWAKALYSLGQYEKAIVPYRQAMKLKPHDWWNYTSLCVTLYRLNRYEETIKACQAGLLKKNGHHWSRIRLLEAFLMQNQWQNALTACQTLFASQDMNVAQKAAAYGLCGVTQLKLNQVDLAMKNCQTALTLYQDEDFAYWCFGEAFMLQKQPTAAAALYEKAVDLKPEKAFYYYKWGQALAESQEYEQAIMAYQKAIQFDKVGNFSQDVQALLEEAQQSISPEILTEEAADTDRLKVP